MICGTVQQAEALSARRSSRPSRRARWRRYRALADAILRAMRWLHVKAYHTGRYRAARWCALETAKAAAPFVSGLEYGAPARGVWNIVHIGMLLPAHRIYSLRGETACASVVLTAAEMNAQREPVLYTIIKENNVLDGDIETLLIEGVTDILHRLPSLPPAVLVFTSCIHHLWAATLRSAGASALPGR